MRETRASDFYAVVVIKLQEDFKGFSIESESVHLRLGVRIIYNPSGCICPSYFLLIAILQYVSIYSEKFVKQVSLAMYFSTLYLNEDKSICISYCVCPV